jgi:hypothetical protein
VNNIGFLVYQRELLAYKLKTINYKLAYLAYQTERYLLLLTKMYQREVTL